MATTFLRSIGIPCLLYIDDRHNGQLQVPLDSGQYATLTTKAEKYLAAAKSAIFLATFYLVRLGYFLGLKKSILFPRKIVPYLGFLADSERQVFHLLPDKKENFLNLVRDILRMSHIPLKTLQRLVGKCVSFSMVVPAARLYTREMNLAISMSHLGKGKLIAVEGRLRQEITRWLFLEDFNDPLPWRDERHVRISLATDASNSGCGGQLLSPGRQAVSDYWAPHESNWDIATKEAVAIEKVLQAFRQHILNARVDVMVDNQAVIHSWNNQGSRSPQLNDALKCLFFTTVALNVSLHLTYIPSHVNLADKPSRRSSSMDSALTGKLWQVVEAEFSCVDGHSVDLMALDSNTQHDRLGNPLPHFTPEPSPASAGINLFAQDLRQHQRIMRRPYVFPPSVLVGPVFSFLRTNQQDCTFLVMDVFPRKYWWPLLQASSKKVTKLASRGDITALRLPTSQGWMPHPGLPGDLWTFAVSF